MINVLISKVIVRFLTLRTLTNVYFLIESTEIFTPGNNCAQPRSSMALNKYVSTKPRSITVGGLNSNSAIQTSHSQMCFISLEENFCHQMQAMSRKFLSLF